MTAREDGTPRFRLATVEVRTWGRFCENAILEASELCPFFRPNGSACGLYGERLYTGEWPGIRFERCHDCLAADEVGS